MEEVKVLDHGYIKLIETWGSDARIIEAARMSTDKGFMGWKPEYTYVCSHCHYTRVVDHALVDAQCPSLNHCNIDMTLESKHPGDERLLKYLYEHAHATPFEFAGMVIEVQAPIFVFREWHRHRVQSYNEMSARYTPLPDFNYMPTVERCMMVSGTNKQAGKVKDAADLTHDAALSWLDMLQNVYEHAEEVYQAGLCLGIPKEVARLPVPVGRYSRMRASTCLRNWLAFLTLRSEKNPHAQWEIRQFGNSLGPFIEQAFPRTWQLFKN